MNKPEIIILVGSPGSGKSTYCSTVLSSYYRISQDEQGKEEHFSIFTKQLALGKDLVIDRMNFSREQRERYLAPARSAGYKTKIIIFHVPFDTCFSRCVTRENHPTITTHKEASKALNFFFKSYERVSDFEGDEILRLGWDGEKESAIICDIDNTLADATGRESFLHKTPKDWDGFFSKLGDDPINNWCSEILYRFQDSTRIILCSARPDKYRKPTEDWLLKHNVDFNKLFMRGRNDFRKDDLVKNIILDFELKTRYDILFCLDDRSSVIQMYRNNGCVVLDCAGNEF